MTGKTADALLRKLNSFSRHFGLSSKPVKCQRPTVYLEINLTTRMHSSRMRTFRSTGRISRGVSALGGCLLLGGVCSWEGVCSWGQCLLLGGVCSGRCLLLGGVCSWRGCLLGGCGIPACTEADTPTPLWTDRRL